MAAFELGWAVLKNQLCPHCGSTLLIEDDGTCRECGEWVANEPSRLNDPLLGLGNTDILLEIANAFLGTVPGFLEEGQENYVRGAVSYEGFEPSDAQIRAGRALALNHFDTHASMIEELPHTW